jgi:hypothetical protein
MARIPIVREDDPATPPEAREFLKRIGQPRARGGMGEVFDSIRLFANHPQKSSAIIDCVQAIRGHNSLTPVLTELAWTTASIVNRCHY